MMRMYVCMCENVETARNAEKKDDDVSTRGRIQVSQVTQLYHSRFFLQGWNVSMLARAVAGKITLPGAT